jgi:hypothetical protein
MKTNMPSDRHHRKMTPERRDKTSKSINYFIGASTLLLALMLFSQLSCSILGLCTNWFPPAQILGFWEMMAISTAGLVGALSLRFIRRTSERRTADNSGTSDHPPAASSPVAPHSSTTTNTLLKVPTWKRLFNQMSDEEKESLRSMMEERCFAPHEKASDSGPEVTGEPS